MPSRYSDERAGELRERYRSAFGGDELPVPVEAIAADLLGLRVREARDLGASGLLLPARREIWLEAGEQSFPGRRRFTIAHELGHWVCQVCTGSAAAVYCRARSIDEQAGGAQDGGQGREPGGHSVLASDPVAHDLEREANVFAAELLMPEPLVVEHANGCGADPATLAVLFGVSGLAMHWRLFNLGVVAERPPSAEKRPAAEDGAVPADS